MTDIEKFDPSTLMQGVKDRIKSTFVSLIPEAKWEELCKKEIDEFFEEKHIDKKEYKSDFRQICREILGEIAKEKIKEALTEYDSLVWEGSERKVNDKLKELLIKCAPDIWAAQFGSMFQNIVHNMKRY